MAEITAALVMELRAKSGVGMMDCKKALQETDGDINAAIDWLRAKGLSKAAKKAGRVAAEGLIGNLAVLRHDQGLGVVVTTGVQHIYRRNFPARTSGAILPDFSKVEAPCVRPAWLWWRMMAVSGRSSC